jgi:hypothetical protein
MRGGRVYGYPNFDLRGNDAEAIRFENWSNFNAKIGFIQNTIGDAVVVSSKCFEWDVEILGVFPYDSQGTKTARGFVVDDKQSTNPPGDGYVYINTETNHAEGVACLAGGNIKVDGKLENANGEANLLGKSGGGLITAASTLSISSSVNGAHGIKARDKLDCSAGPNRIGGVAGDGINAVGANQAYIGNQAELGTAISGNSINIDDVPGYVPHPESFISGVPDVSYPSAQWNSLSLQHGGALIRENTDTVSAGSTKQIEGFADLNNGRQYMSIEVQWDSSSIGSDAAVHFSYGADAGNNKSAIYATETLGNTSIDIAFRIWGTQATI